LIQLPSLLCGSVGGKCLIGATMADETKTDKVTLEELMVSTVAMTEALAKLLIAKGIITDDEFQAQLSVERRISSCAEAVAITVCGRFSLRAQDARRASIEALAALTGPYR
jgi:ketopantoate hydroxymethyltransferase